MSDLYKIYCELNSLDGFKSNSERLLAVQIKAANEVASELRAEVLEQARLLDVSAEREAKLLAEIERLRARVEELERVRAAAQALIDYEDAGPDSPCGLCWMKWEEKFQAMRDALKETAP